MSFRIALLTLAAILPATARAEPPRPDTYGDPLPSGAVGQLGTVRFRHGGIVADIAFAPDGRSLATCGTDHALRVWDAVSGKQFWAVEAEPGAGLWNVQTGKALSVASNIKAYYSHVRFSPDGKTLAWVGSAHTALR